MPYTVDPKTGNITCETAEQALALSRLLNHQDARLRPIAVKDAPIQRRRGRPPTNGKSKRAEREEKAAAATLAFVKALSRAGHKGLSAQQIVGVLGLGGPRGVGGATVSIKRILGESGFTPADAFRMRGIGKARRWKPGSRLNAVIQALSNGSESEA